ncbi:AMP-binding protein [Streptacidiphilus melanogenes]|uniref:AMP-binding protein n=1 Tax=Streptacidiphilus melanogenes TaxID=411235 RepID=UPI0005A86355|nr:AMP-binding protein [Streptacidiphilus melanogenes]
MSDDRPALASTVIAGRSRIDGRSVGGDDRRGLVHDGLAKAGVRSGDVVLLTDPNPADLVTAMLATWLVDAVPLVAPHDRNLPDQLQGVCRVECDLHVTPATQRVTVPGLDRTAVLMPTSGSTGTPKLARRGVAGVRVESAGYRDYLALTPADRVAVPVPVTHSYGWGVVMSALLADCDIDTTPATAVRKLASLLDSGDVSVVALTAGLARLLVEVKRAGNQRVRAALVGAGGVPDELDATFVTRFGRPLHRGFGSTETGGTFLGTRGIGRPIAGITVRQPTESGRAELVLEMSAPVEGLLGDEPRRVWHTGDIVERDSNGVYHHVARATTSLRLNNRYVDPEAISHALRATPGVTDVQLLVLGREKTPEIEDLYAVVEARPGIGADELERPLAELPAGVPRPRVVCCVQLPRNVLGKLDRDGLITLVRKEISGGA